MKLSIVQIIALLFALIVIGFAFILTSCNVTRTVTTKAEYYQRGDTTVQIVTRTVESYDGSVQPDLILKK